MVLTVSACLGLVLALVYGGLDYNTRLWAVAVSGSNMANVGQFIAAKMLKKCDRKAFNKIYSSKKMRTEMLFCCFLACHIFLVQKRPSSISTSRIHTDVWSGYDRHSTLQNYKINKHEGVFKCNNPMWVNKEGASLSGRIKIRWGPLLVPNLCYISFIFFC